MGNTYVNEYTVLGMMSRYGRFENGIIIKSKKGNKITVFDSEFKSDEYDEINYAYMTKKPVHTRKYYALTEVRSIFGFEYFNNFNNNKDIKETVRKYEGPNNFISVYNSPMRGIDEVLEMIEEWRYSKQGWKYGFQEHAGYDKSFFLNYYEKEKNNLQCLFFYHKDILIGYSVIEKTPSSHIDNLHEYKYLIRKYRVAGFRNLCKFIDFVTFEKIYDKELNDFVVNWGASGGGVLKYKTCSWFPVHSKEERYFWKYKKEIKIDH